MEVSVKVQKIIKFGIYHTVLLISGGGVDEVLARFSFIEKNYEGCQFDVQFIQC